VRIENEEGRGTIALPPQRDRSDEGRQKCVCVHRLSEVIQAGKRSSESRQRRDGRLSGIK
jgi:hypothetical protein